MNLKKTCKTVFLLLLILTLFSTSVLPAFALSPSIAVSSLYTQSPYYTNLLNVELTGDMRKDLVAIAQSQLGYCEGNNSSQLAGTVAGDNNYVEYNKMLYNGQNVAWCGNFVSWCAAMANIPSTIIYRTGAAKPGNYSYSFRFFGKYALEGADFKGFLDLPIKGGAFIPSPGDLVFFSSSKATSNPESLNYKHVGIVESAKCVYSDDGKLAQMIITTIEGNTSDKVKRMTYEFTEDSNGRVYSGTYLGGFGIPAYGDGQPSYSCYDIGAYTTALKLNAASGDLVIKLQLALRLLAESNPKITSVPITGNYDYATYQAVKDYQDALGLEVDGSCGRQTWTSVRAKTIEATASVQSDYIMSGNTVLLYKGNGCESTLPEGCTEIAPYAFYQNDSLITLNVNRTLRTIQEGAFYGCALQNVIFLGNEDAFSLTISSKNEAFTTAKHTYKPTMFTITFDVNGNKTLVSCAEGSTPVFTGSTDRAADEYIYYFTGWDKPIVKATCDTTYTATYYSLPNVPVVVTGASQKQTVLRGEFLEFDVYLQSSPGVSSFCFNVDYIACLSDLSFINFTPAVDGVQFEQFDGIVKLSYEGETLPEGTIKVGTICFDVFSVSCYEPGETTDAQNDVVYLESSELQIVFSVIDGYIKTLGTKGTEYELPVICDLVSLALSNALQGDYDSDGSLTISDVTALLTILSDPNSQNGSYAGLTISDVTALLNLLSSK